MACDNNCLFMMDEFYSHFVYDDDPEKCVTHSSAAFVEDVNADPIVIINGLTKCWRLPGWRICWVCRCCPHDAFAAEGDPLSGSDLHQHFCFGCTQHSP